MEDRLENTGDTRHGITLIALVVILAVTAAWWALALWPVGSSGPEWLDRTRAACFGSIDGGLPNAGGWILLIGEPAGMLAALVALWGKSLRRDLKWFMSTKFGTHAIVVVLCACVAGAASAAAVVTRAMRVADVPLVTGSMRVPVNRPSPAFTLLDQHGRQTSLSDFRGKPALVTVAFGHCETVCPAVVAQLQEARRRGQFEDAPIIIITLDPWRDTPDRLATLARHWKLSDNDRVLSGGVSEVQAALDSLGIGRSRNEANGDMVHSATVIHLDRNGVISWRTEGT